MRLHDPLGVCPIPALRTKGFRSLSEEDWVFKIGHLVGRCPLNQQSINGQKSTYILLRWRVCRVNFARKIFVLSYDFSYEKCSEISPEILSLYSVGQEKSSKIPAKFPTKFPKFPCGKSKKITNELLQEHRENILQHKLFGPHPRTAILGHQEKVYVPHFLGKNAKKGPT